MKSFLNRDRRQTIRRGESPDQEVSSKRRAKLARVGITLCLRGFNTKVMLSFYLSDMRQIGSTLLAHCMIRAPIRRFPCSLTQLLSKFVRADCRRSSPQARA